MSLDQATAIWKRWGISLLLFGLALAARLPGLGSFTTIDEPRWINRSRWFLTGILFPGQECPPVAWGREFAAEGLACTLQIGYPGVTTMGAGSLGLLVHYWQTARPAGIELLTYLQTLSIYRLDPTLISPTRLLPAIAGALFGLLFYLFLQRLFGRSVAGLAALILVLQPYHIALSRVLHHDALTTTFMVLSLLALTGYWLHGWSRYWLLISGLLAGLALLSKQVSWFMLPFAGLLAGWTLLWRHRCHRAPVWATSRRLAGEGLVWSLAAALTVVAFFPAMWVVPGQALQVIFTASTGLAEVGHTHYFLGEISNNPGPLFYPVGWLLRATPFEIIGLLAGLAALTGLLWQGRLGCWSFRHPVETGLLLFVVLLWVFVSLSNKKLVRYYLPAFPVIDIFVAIGLVWLLKRLPEAWRRWRRRAVLGLAGLILVGQGWLVLVHYPYYLTYHNPLFGGSDGAARLMTIIGWGELLDQAGDYLNRQPEAGSAQVVAERYCSTLRPFFAGRVRCLNSTFGGILQADYVVYYYNVVQRNLQWPEQWTYFQQHHEPAHRLSRFGLDYVLIYRNPIRHQVDRQANHIPRALTAFGYNLAPGGRLTLFWQNEGLGDRSLRLGLAPTSGVYPLDSPSPSRGARRWIDCIPAPGFGGKLETPGAVIESTCSLDEADLAPGLYDLRLAVADDSGLQPIEAGLLGVMSLDAADRFETVDLVEAR